ncbi:TonB-dependent receptor, partial [Bordetella holmesii H620]
MSCRARHGVCLPRRSGSDRRNGRHDVES